MTVAVRDEIRDARHRPVLLHDLAHDAGGNQSGKTREVDCGLRLTGTHEHAAVARTQREDVTRLDEIVRRTLRIDRDLDRPRTVRRGDAGRAALARLDR